MTPIGRARIVRRATAEPQAIAIATAPRRDAGLRARRVLREEVDAHAAAERVLAIARREADRTIALARREASDVKERAREEARREEHETLAASYLALRVREERRAEADLDRAIALAVVLAERLLVASLELEPARIRELARHALAEARGSRRACIEANPADVEALTSQMDALGAPAGSLELRPNALLARGDLRVHTDVGGVEALLKPQLERLSIALREALANG